ncbi:MAG: hypothetical protein ABI234_03715 [Ktedonobacteraceae bacterium]
MQDRASQQSEYDVHFVGAVMVHFYPHRNGVGATILSERPSTSPLLRVGGWFGSGVSPAATAGHVTRAATTAEASHTHLPKAEWASGPDSPEE